MEVEEGFKHIFKQSPYGKKELLFRHRKPSCSVPNELWEFSLAALMLLPALNYRAEH